MRASYKIGYFASFFPLKKVCQHREDGGKLAAPLNKDKTFIFLKNFSEKAYYT